MSEDRPIPGSTGHAPDAALLAAAMEAVAVGLVVVDSELRVVLWNGWMADNSGLSAEQVHGRLLGEVFPDSDFRALRRKVQQVLMLGNQAFFDAHTHGALFPLKRVALLDPRFQHIQQSCTLSPLPSCQGLVCISISDETAAVLAEQRLKEAHLALEETSRRDSLTGLFNRHTVCDRLDEEILRSRRTGLPTSIVLFDIDHFKQINDSWGHLAGDAVLRAVGRGIQGVVRETDLPGRYGGEEFLVVLPDTGDAGAATAATRLHQAIRALRVIWQGQRIPVTASFGQATLIEEETADQLLGRADRALYAAKNDGRDRIRVAC